MVSLTLGIGPVGPIGTTWGFVFAAQYACYIVVSRKYAKFGAIDPFRGSRTVELLRTMALTAKDRHGLEFQWFS